MHKDKTSRRRIQNRDSQKKKFSPKIEKKIQLDSAEAADFNGAVSISLCHPNNHFQV